MSSPEGRIEIGPRGNEQVPMPVVNLLTDRVYADIIQKFKGREIPHPDIKRVLVFPDREQTSLAAAQQKIEVGRINPSGFFLNPTGATFELIHDMVARAVKRGQVDFSHTLASHLDGYHPYPSTGEYSFARYINERVIIPLGILEGNYKLINEEVQDPEEEARLHNEWIRSHTQTMAQYGIGPDGHLAFILPGTPFDVETRYVPLSPETIYRDQIERGQDTPEHAITIGPRNIIDGATGHIQIVLFGEQKGKKLNEALTGEITPLHTASLLRLPSVKDAVTIFTDEQTAETFDWNRSLRQGALYRD